MVLFELEEIFKLEYSHMGKAQIQLLELEFLMKVLF
jgi:hypothetical protein